MREKSSLAMIFLSFIPGLTHFYLGLKNRAIIFMLAFFGAIVGTFGLFLLSGTDTVFLVLLFALPVIWLIAIIDAFAMRDKIFRNHSGNNVQENYNIAMEKSNRKTITMILSIVPGAGHMFLGLQRRGLSFMSLFFFTIFFMGWLNISLFLFILPIIWFYSFFDAFHCISNENINDNVDFLPIKNLKHKWIGWGLIIMGIMVILDRIIYPLIPWEIQRYMQTSIVAILLIGGGIKLLMGDKKELEEVNSWEEEE
ncbi:hypothetical protein [Clostridiisalibacter paucivorans]|uniref:hypothetical protein n=1 Tax=Clostridiisalibacter paucivorans TaxID=408753 RepID=UPI0006863B39|nr:hypothetical protein [Clostridiisalibacter paucivorans]